MLTVTAKLQYDQCRKEINKLQYEQTIIATQIEITASRLGKMEAPCNGDKKALAELKTHSDYQEIAAYDAALDTRKEAIESELAVLNQEMKNFENLHKEGIKESTTFWCFGS